MIPEPIADPIGGSGPERIELLLAAERAASARLGLLQRLTEALSEACTVEEVADAAVVHASAAFGAVGTVIALILPDGETLELVKASHMADDTFESWRRFPLASATPLADAARTGEPRLLGSRAEWQAHYPELLPLVVREGHHANAVVPLLVNRRTIGAVGMAFDTPRDFDSDERGLMHSAARQCALALERARLFEAERVARAEAEGASRAKSEFLAVMSHELRTPLNAIGGYAELLELGIRGPVTTEQVEDLHRIQTATRHLTALVTDVLNYVRVETGHVQYVVEDVAVGTLLDGMEALVMPQLAAKGLQYGQEPCDRALLVRADAEKVRQVLVNLLTNAQKFTAAGGRVTLGVTADQREVRIFVHDTGQGIATEKLQSIFEPFVQVDKRLTRTNDGVGLGLAISRDLARGMGGDLAAESVLGEGSTFTLTLPRA